MEYGSLDGGEDGEYSGVGLVEISLILTTYAAFFLEMHNLTGFTIML